MNGDTKIQATKEKNKLDYNKIRIFLCIKGHDQQTENATYGMGKICK